MSQFLDHVKVTAVPMAHNTCFQVDMSFTHFDGTRGPFIGFAFVCINQINLTTGMRGDKKRLGPMNYRTKKQWKQMTRDNMFRFFIPNTHNNTLVFEFPVLLGNPKYNQYDTEFDTVTISVPPMDNTDNTNNNDT